SPAADSSRARPQSPSLACINRTARADCDRRPRWPAPRATIARVRAFAAKWDMPNLFSLEGKTALITGGSRGIGYAIARAYIDAGARVIITARGVPALNAAAEALGPNVLALPCDNADPSAIVEMVEAAWRLGPTDILVNNAGISPFYKRAEHV